MEIYTRNPNATQQQGLARIEVDKIGQKRKVILIDRKEFTNAGKKNQNFGKPMPEHKWIQSIGGLAIPESKARENDWDVMRPSVITISDHQCDPNDRKCATKNLEIGKWYDVKLTNKTADKNVESWELNCTSVSKFTENEGMTLDLKDIPSYYGAAFFAPLNELAQYHDTFAVEGKTKTGAKNPDKTVSNRVVCTRGSVIDIVPGEDGNNTRLVLDDELLGSLENSESVTCWLSASQKITFGKFSEIYVWGTTSRQKKKDMATNTVLDDWALPSITVNGFQIVELVEPEVSVEKAGDGKFDAADSDEIPAEVNEPDISQVKEIDSKQKVESKPKINAKDISDTLESEDEVESDDIEEPEEFKEV
jgi:hypothetical protein